MLVYCEQSTRVYVTQLLNFNVWSVICNVQCISLFSFLISSGHPLCISITQDFEWECLYSCKFGFLHLFVQYNTL